MGNIIGEPINGEILKQVKNRQKLQGAGYNSESVKRDPEVLNYLSNLIPHCQKDMLTN